MKGTPAPRERWAVQRARYMTLETIAPMRDGPAVSLPALASLTGPAIARVDQSA